MLSPFRNPFHAGYVVQDLAKAMRGMRNSLGVAHWKIVPLPDGAPAKALALARIGCTMIELIEVTAKEEPLATARGWICRPDAEATFNHLAYTLDSEDEVRALVARLEVSGIATASLDGFGEIFSLSYYADTRAQLGHLTEFVCFGPAAGDFLDAVPRN